MNQVNFCDEFVTIYHHKHCHHYYCYIVLLSFWQMLLLLLLLLLLSMTCTTERTSEQSSPCQRDDLLRRCAQNVQCQVRTFKNVSSSFRHG